MNMTAVLSITGHIGILRCAPKSNRLVLKRDTGRPESGLLFSSLFTIQQVQKQNVANIACITPGLPDN
jgi:hypothetical protein